MLKNDILKYAVKERMGRRNCTIEKRKKEGSEKDHFSPTFGTSLQSIKATHPENKPGVHCPDCLVRQGQPK
jgi:hypothetical protein